MSTFLVRSADSCWMSDNSTVCCSGHGDWVKILAGSTAPQTKRTRFKSVADNACNKPKISNTSKFASFCVYTDKTSKTALKRSAATVTEQTCWKARLIWPWCKSMVTWVLRVSGSGDTIWLLTGSGVATPDTWIKQINYRRHTYTAKQSQLKEDYCINCKIHAAAVDPYIILRLFLPDLTTSMSWLLSDDCWSLTTLTTSSATSRFISLTMFSWTLCTGKSYDRHTLHSNSRYSNR